MNEFLLTLLSLSVSGTLVAILLLTLHPFIRHRFAQSWQYYIVLIVIMRLLLPISPERNLIGSWFEQAIPTVELVMNRAGAHIISDLGESYMTGKAAAQFASAINAKSSIWDLLWVVWLLGAVAMLAWKFTKYVQFHRQLHIAHKKVTGADMLAVLYDCRRELRIKQQIPLYQNSLAPTPMLLGLLRPAIVLPDRTYREDELRYIFLHELTHYKRRDLWYKWLMQAAHCVHWFNPALLWVAKKLDRACELSCDEAVIRTMNAKEKQGYGNILIAMSASGAYKHTVGMKAMGEEKRYLKERLTAIMNSGKRKSKMVNIFSIALTVIMIGGALYSGSFIKAGVQSTVEAVSPTLYAGYNLEKMSADRTPYVGNHSKVSRLAAQLLVPDPYYAHRYIALQTTEQPYGLTVFYEPATDDAIESPVRPDHGPHSRLAEIARNHALVLFAMIDNVDEITFAFRGSPSAGELEQSEYDIHLTYFRSDFAEQVDFHELSGDLDALGKWLEESNRKEGL